MNDLLLYGNIITMDPDNPRAEAVAVKDGKITFAGSRKEAFGLSARRTVDYAGRTILPGFIDTHVHVIPAGIFMNGADLAGASDLADVLSRLREQAEKSPKGWILGAYFQDKLIPEKRFPTLAELDGVSADRPVLICHNDLHPIALNSKALSILKVKPGPDGVLLDEDGKPNGKIEDPAVVGMLGDILAKMGVGSILRGIMKVDEYAAAHGVTTVFGKDVLAILMMREIFKDLFRVEFVPMWYSDGCRDIDSLEGIVKNRFLRGRACVCAFADGAFDGHSAATAEPYADRPDTCGILNYTDQEIYDFTMAAHKAGLQVSFHAIGDAAIDQVLRVYERVLRDAPKEDHRLRIEHFEEPAPEAIEKAARLGVALSMQPLLIEVCERTDFSGYEPFIGLERTKRCSPYRSILDKGILVGGGTDFPVTPMDVLHGARILMTHPVESERITLEEALAINTRDAAKLGFLEDRKGMLRAGMDADMVVLDRDPFEVSAEELSEIRIVETIAKGRKIYTAPDSAAEAPDGKSGLPDGKAGEGLSLPGMVGKFLLKKVFPDRSGF